MPRLKDISCSVRYADSDIPFKEYGAQYADGYVQTYIAVPDHTQSFLIQLQSHKYIAPGLAMFVFIDGNLHCNRNRTNLRRVNQGEDIHLEQVNFRVRQRESKDDEAQMFIGRRWQFQRCNIIPLQYLPDDTRVDDFSHIGEIEVIILRCEQLILPDDDSNSGTDMTAQDTLYGPSNQAAEPAVPDSRDTNMGAKYPETNYQAPAVEAVPDTDDEVADALGGLDWLDGAGDDPVQAVFRLGLDGTNEQEWNANSGGHSPPRQQGQGFANPYGYPAYASMPPPPWMYQQSMMNPYAWTSAPYTFQYVPAYPPMMAYPPPGHPVAEHMSPYRRNFSQYAPANNYQTPNGTRGQSGWNANATQQDPLRWSSAPAVYVNVAHSNAGPNWSQTPPPAQAQAQGHGWESSQQSRAKPDRENVAPDSSWRNEPSQDDNDIGQNGDNEQNDPNPVNNSVNDGDQTDTWKNKDDNKYHAPNNTGSPKNESWNDNNNQTNAVGGDGGADWQGNTEGPSQNNAVSSEWNRQSNQNNPSPPTEWNQPQQQQSSQPQQPTPSEHGPAAANQFQQMQPGDTAQSFPEETAGPFYGPFGVYHSTRLSMMPTRSGPFDADPIYDVPEPLRQNFGITHQVRPVEGYAYWHKRVSPTYLDTFDDPYAKFVFKYREPEIIQQITSIPVSPPLPQTLNLTSQAHNLDHLSYTDLLTHAHALTARLCHPSIPEDLRLGNAAAPSLSTTATAAPQQPAAATTASFIAPPPPPRPRVDFLGYKHHQPEPAPGLGISGVATTSSPPATVRPVAIAAQHPPAASPAPAPRQPSSSIPPQQEQQQDLSSPTHAQPATMQPVGSGEWQTYDPSGDTGDTGAGDAAAKPSGGW